MLSVFIKFELEKKWSLLRQMNIEQQEINCLSKNIQKTILGWKLVFFSVDEI